MHAILMGDVLREMSVKKKTKCIQSRVNGEGWREMSWRRERESKRPLLDEWPDIK
jgi:hypothetical protein